MINKGLLYLHITQIRQSPFLYTTCSYGLVENHAMAPDFFLFLKITHKLIILHENKNPVAKE